MAGGCAGLAGGGFVGLALALAGGCAGLAGGGFVGLVEARFVGLVLAGGFIGLSSGGGLEARGRGWLDALVLIGRIRVKKEDSKEWSTTYIHRW